MSRKPAVVSTRRRASEDYDSISGLGRAVVRVEEQIVNLEEKFDARAEHVDANHEMLNNKMDQLLEAVGQFGHRLTGFAGQLDAQRGDLHTVSQNLNTVAGRVEANELSIRRFEKKDDFRRGAIWAFNWTYVKIGGAICAVIGLIGWLIQYRPWTFLTG